VPGTPQPAAPLGGATGASPEAASPDGSGSPEAAALASNKRRLTGGLRRLRSALQDFASVLSSSGTPGGTSGGGSGGGGGGFIGGFTGGYNGGLGGSGGSMRL
jgi:hypothetical protein